MIATLAGGPGMASGVEVTDTAASPVAEAATPATGAPAAWLGSKTKVPPAPTVRLLPSGKAPALATISVPALFTVPPA